MYELNIQTVCTETSSVIGRVERAHLTLQDRLVKELVIPPYSKYDRLSEIDQGESWIINGLEFIIYSAHIGNQTIINASANMLA